MSPLNLITASLFSTSSAPESGLEALWAHVFFKLRSLLVVIIQLVQVFGLGLGWSFKVAKVFGVQVAHLHWVAHLEVDLIRVKTKSLHLCSLQKYN